MTQESQKPNTVLIIVAIISVVGTIIAATIGVIGNYNVEKFRQEAELTRIAIVSISTQMGSIQISPTQSTPLQTTPMPKPITITVTNNSCIAQDFYVDGNLILSPIGAGNTLTFNSMPGKYSVYTCVPNTNTCAEKVWSEWTISTTQYIGSTTKVQCP